MKASESIAPPTTILIILSTKQMFFFTIPPLGLSSQVEYNLKMCLSVFTAVLILTHVDLLQVCFSLSACGVG